MDKDQIWTVLRSAATAFVGEIVKTGVPEKFKFECRCLPIPSVFCRRCLWTAAATVRDPFLSLAIFIRERLDPKTRDPVMEHLAEKNGQRDAITAVLQEVTEVCSPHRKIETVMAKKNQKV